MKILMPWYWFWFVLINQEMSHRCYKLHMTSFKIIKSSKNPILKLLLKYTSKWNKHVKKFYFCHTPLISRSFKSIKYHITNNWWFLQFTILFKLSNIFINKHERGDTLFPANTKPNDNSITNKHSPGQKYEGGR